MQQYLDTVADVLETGTYKPNRTGVDTISGFSKHYAIDLSEGYPLLTTKKMDGFRWDSMIHELLWYLSGEEHIRKFREKSKLWDAWANEDGELDTAYGRFWRRFPVPDEDDQLPGESWVGEDNDWVTSEETENGEERLTFDQIQYVIDRLKESPHSRRHVVQAWHPANTSVSTLPPCHYTFVFSVQGDRLNLHLTQRSADIALGVPFNIASYSLLLTMVAQETGFKPGTFSHTLVDAHVYCGTGDRGEWYAENMDELQEKVQEATYRTSTLRGRVTGAIQKKLPSVVAENVPVVGDPVLGYEDVREWIEENAPEGETDPRGKPYDHVPGLLTQLSRDPLDRPEIDVPEKQLDEIEKEDIDLTGYESHDGIDFGVAE